jgi:hypothetical protein
MSTMNMERMLLLAEEVERPTLDIGFDMGQWCNRVASAGAIRANPCGTVCCLAGLTVLLFGCASDSPCAGFNRAKELLGIRGHQAGCLFDNGNCYIAPRGIEPGLAHITRAQAAAAIRRMVAEERAAIEVQRRPTVEVQPAEVEQEKPELVLA